MDFSVETLLTFSANILLNRSDCGNRLDYSKNTLLIHVEFFYLIPQKLVKM